jgi:hypothetical protein
MNQSTEPQAQTEFPLRAIVLFGSLVPPAAFFFFLLFQLSGENVYTAALLTLPGLLGALVWHRWLDAHLTHRHVKDPLPPTSGAFSGIVLANLIFLCVLHAIFKLMPWHDYADTAKLLPLAFVFVNLFGTVWFVQHLIMDGKGPPSAPQWAKMAQTVRSAPVEAMITAFILFLFLTYFLAYAVAFDDRGGRPEANGKTRSLIGEYDTECPPADKALAPVVKLGRDPIIGPDWLIQSAFADPSPNRDEEACREQQIQEIVTFQEGLPRLIVDGAFMNPRVGERICTLRNESGWRESASKGRSSDVRRTAENSLALCRVFEFLDRNINECKRHVKLDVLSIPTSSGDISTNRDIAISRRDVVYELFATKARDLDVNQSTGAYWLTVTPSPPVVGGYTYPEPRVEIIATVDTAPYQLQTALADLEQEIEDVSQSSGMILKEIQHIRESNLGAADMQRVIEQGSELQRFLESSLLALQVPLDQLQQGQQALRDQVSGLISPSGAFINPGTTSSTSDQSHRNDECKRSSRPLMDYIYFMIYTTTTTGYGDLRPASPFTKFVVSLANLIEVFFIVIFFNLVIGALRGPNQHRAAPSAPSTDSN